MTVDSGYDGYRHDLISSTCEQRGWEYRIVHTEIGEVMDDLLDAQRTPCSLCARLRRGVLYRLADEVGATKIALGHHLDDFIETLLLNLFFAGALKAMPARLVSDNGEHVVIRPLVYVTEVGGAQLREGRSELPIIGCCCPACGDLEPAAPAGQAADRGARGRASRGQELDDPRARQRRQPPPARPAPEPAAGAARCCARRWSGAVAVAQVRCQPSNVASDQFPVTKTYRPEPRLAQLEDCELTTETSVRRPLMNRVLAIVDGRAGLCGVGVTRSSGRS